MADQAGQKIHHRTCHAADLDQQTEKHKQRHRQQDDMAHALVNARHNHGERRAGGDGEKGKGSQSEGKDDRGARQDQGTDQKNEKHNELVIAHRHQQRFGRIKPAPDRQGDRKRQGHQCDAMRPPHAHQANQQHQGNADRQSDGAPDIGDFQRGRDDHDLVNRIFDGGVDHETQKHNPRGQSKGLEKRAASRRGRTDQGRHAHMFGALIGDHRPHHRQPQKQDGGELIRPDQRLAIDITGHNTGKQNNCFHQHQDRSHKSRDARNGLFHRVKQAV